MFSNRLKIITLTLMLMAAFSHNALTAEKPQMTYAATAQFAYTEATGDMQNYFSIGRGVRADLFAGVTLPMVEGLGAAGLGLDFTYLDFEPRDSGDMYRFYQWDWFKLPAPSLRMGPLELHASIGLFWNVLDISIASESYSDAVIRPGFNVTGGIAVNFGPNVALIADARYQWMFRNRENFISGNSADVSMNHPVYFAGLRFRI